MCHDTLFFTKVNLILHFDKFFLHFVKIILQKIKYNRIFLDLTIGIDDITASDYLFSIYPSVASNCLTIEMKAESFRSRASVYNTQGQLIVVYKLDEPKTTIDISRLTAGIYYITLSNEESTISKKFVKQ